MNSKITQLLDSTSKRFDEKFLADGRPFTLTLFGEMEDFLLQSNLELLAAVREMFENSNWEKEFDFQFVVPNQGSKTGFWWKVPPVGVSEEYASPVEVKKFIRHFFITALSEGKEKV